MAHFKDKEEKDSLYFPLLTMMEEGVWGGEEKIAF